MKESFVISDVKFCSCVSGTELAGSSYLTVSYIWLVELGLGSEISAKKEVKEVLREERGNLIQ